MRIVVLLFVSLLSATPLCAAERWWPAQKPPNIVVRSKPAANDAEEMLQQSVAGLVAQAVNDGRADEMVWLDEGHRSSYARWYRGMIQRLGAREEGPLATLDLVRRYAGRGIIKGYIVYRIANVPEGLSKSERRKVDTASDESVNVATTLAGLMGGVIVSEGLEPVVKALGLPQLFDARGKTSTWCFQNYQQQLNRSFVLSQKPRIAYTRDFAIAHRMFVFWGNPELTTSVYSWLNPLSTVIGWVGNEGDDVGTASRYGHVVVASDLCLNLPLLSAGVDTRTPSEPLKDFDPRSIDASDTRSAVAFVMSDGDNLQWTIGGFFDNDNYWANPDHGKFPIGFGVPVRCLQEMSPDVLTYAAATQPHATTVVEASGYIFPDTFGAALDPDRRRESLAQHARRLGQSMAASGVSSLVFICRDVNSPAAIEAYEIYAREIEDLAGMFVVQYAPYEAGDGRIHWVKDRTGAEVPVVTSKFSLWANNKNAGAGNPDRVSGLINEAAGKARAAGQPTNLWVMTHAWSPFRRDEAGDGNAVRDLPFGSHAGKRGVTPTAWCVEKLDQRDVRVVSPTELLWRIRMQRRAP